MWQLINSFISARSLFQEEDDSSKLTYSEVNFSKRTFGSPDGASSGNTGEVIYSAPRVHVSSDVRDDSLYSSVA